jgi:ElaB/YqjD/DUF883 family membrane-anchored ribosome-binding protein
MTNRNDVIAEKRDLHVGGIGRRSSAALSTMAEPLVDPIVDFSDQIVRSAREVVRGADDYVHDNPWAAIGAVAVIGLTAGYLLSRRA